MSQLYIHEGKEKKIFISYEGSKLPFLIREYHREGHFRVKVIGKKVWGRCRTYDITIPKGRKSSEIECNIPEELKKKMKQKLLDRYSNEDLKLEDIDFLGPEELV